MAASDRVWRFTGPCGAMVGCYQQHGHAGPCATVSEHGVEVPTPTPPAAGAPGGAEDVRAAILRACAATSAYWSLPQGTTLAEFDRAHDAMVAAKCAALDAAAAEQAARAAAERERDEAQRMREHYESEWRVANRHACDRIADRDRLAAELAAARGAMEKAAEVFDSYAAIHRAKGGVVAYSKAAANERHARELRAALPAPAAGEVTRG